MSTDRIQRLVVCTLALVFLAGCHMSPPTAEEMAEMMTRPDPAPELQQLSGFIGTWSNEGKFEMPEGMPVPASASEDGQEMPAMPETMKGEHTFSWTMDGRFIKVDGWSEGPDNSRIQVQEFIAWNAPAKKFCSTFFSSWGETGQTWWKMSEDGKTATIWGAGLDGRGNPTEFRGTWRLVDDTNMEWDMEYAGMTMSGTSKKLR